MTHAGRPAHWSIARDHHPSNPWTGPSSSPSWSNTRAMVQPPLGEIREGLRRTVSGHGDRAVEHGPVAQVHSARNKALMEGWRPDRASPGSAVFVDTRGGGQRSHPRGRLTHCPVVPMVVANGPDSHVLGRHRPEVPAAQAQTFARPATYHSVVQTPPGRTSRQVSGAVQPIIGTHMADPRRPLRGARREFPLRFAAAGPQRPGRAEPRAQADPVPRQLPPLHRRGPAAAADSALPSFARAWRANSASTGPCLTAGPGFCGILDP